MRTLDMAPLYKSAIGFDHFTKLMDEAKRSEQVSFPPYNIELVEEDHYRITMAVAGYSANELDIEVEAENLIIKGTKNTTEQKNLFLHQGISAGTFKRRFRLANHVRVVNADLNNGLLHVELVREIPETLKPRKISISELQPETTETLEAKAS